MKLSIVIPTIAGREHWLEKSLAAIKDTIDFPHEILVEHDHAVCGTAWNAGIERATGDYILLSADDLLPVSGWFEAAKDCVDQGFLPSAVVLNPNGTIQSCGDTPYLVPTGTVVTMTRVPFASRKQIEKIYPILPIHYGTDNYFSYRGRMNNWDSVVVQTYMFIHHYATEGRINDRILDDLRIYWEAAGLDEETELQKLEWA